MAATLAVARSEHSDYLPGCSVDGARRIDSARNLVPKVVRHYFSIRGLACCLRWYLPLGKLFREAHDCFVGGGVIAMELVKRRIERCVMLLVHQIHQ